MLETNKKYNTTLDIVKKYNKISFSVNSDKVFKKIDSIATIRNLYKERTYIKYVVACEDCNTRVIKHQIWDDVVTIMDIKNDSARSVYLVNDFLNK
jgi:hypothetical protein